LIFRSSASQNIVYIVDTVTDTYEKEVAVCPTPHGIAFTPDGSKAVVGCYYDLSIIDVATGTYVNNDPDATISGFLAQISGIGVHPTNNRLYAAIGSGFVAHALVAGSATVSTYSPLSASGALMDVAISKDGNTLYVTEAYQGTLEIADINAGDGSLAHNSEAANPSAYYGRLILAPNGEKLYISRYCASQIDYMNTSGTPAMSTFDIQYNSNTYGQRDIALSDDGSVAFVLVGHSFFHTIVVLDTTNGSILGTITLPPSEANSIVYKP
jgi:DNA-binding beta-propeller fold protein YncE